MNRKPAQNTTEMRLDKWLWCARFYKTRNLAGTAIKTGRVKHNGKKIKSGKLIRGGEEISIRRGPYTLDIIIQSLTHGRKSAAEVQDLYTETDTGIAGREKMKTQEQMDKLSRRDNKGRPDSRERRELIRFARRIR